MKEDLFVGIDVAFAKQKKLPICICKRFGPQLIPLSTRVPGLPEVPRGSGNRYTIDPVAVGSFAQQVFEYLCTMETHFGGRIKRVAIDASSAPCPSASLRRHCERDLDSRGISCFPTPTEAQVQEIKRKVRLHFQAGGSEARIPHANQLWMFVGFELFRHLRSRWECLEVYPQAIMRVLGIADIYKRKKEGVLQQLRGVSLQTGWDEGASSSGLIALRSRVQAPAHDAVDAYSCAWIASLEENRREALGCLPEEVIWIPKL